MIKFNSGLKDLVRRLYRDGKVQEVESIWGLSSDKEVTALSKLIVELTMCTDYFKSETKSVLQGRSYRMSGDASVNKNTTVSRVNYDLARLKKILGEDFFDTLMYHKKEMDFDRYTSKIQQLIGKYSRKSILDTVAIKLPKSSETEVKSINKKDWANLELLFTWYTKQSVHDMEKQLTGDMISYIEYLESHSDGLDEVQRKHYDTLQFIKNAESGTV